MKNFLQGANPGPLEWKAEPEKSQAEQVQAFAYLEGLVRYMKSFPGVHFITASKPMLFTGIRLMAGILTFRKLPVLRIG